MRWFARRGEDRTGGYADTYAELVNAVLHNPERDFYLAPNPSTSRTRIRHSHIDVGYWCWFFLDIDPVKSVDDGADPRNLLAQSLLWLGSTHGVNFTRHPPIVIDSGRGLQAWIRLETLALDDALRRKVRLAMSHWLRRMSKELGTVEGCRLDPTCSDLPRVMRCPGTTNYKTGRLASFLHITDHVYVGLGDHLLSRAPSETYDEDSAPSVAVSTWQEAYPHLTLKAQTYLTDGATEPGRHEKAWHTAKCLAERRLHKDEVRRALRYANARRGSENELPPRDIEHALATAFSGLTTEPEFGIVQTDSETEH